MSTFKTVALTAITSAAGEVCANAAWFEAAQRECEQRLYNAISAALSLGATETEIASAMNAGVPG